jgi:N-acyl-D-aspartate/D-glutamate deacylase
MRAPGTASGGRYDLVVNDALVVNATGRFRGSVGVRGGVIAALSEEPLEGDVEVNAAGRPLIPGVVDVHCHFRISQGHGPDAVVSSDDYVIGYYADGGAGAYDVCYGIVFYNCEDRRLL